MSLVLFTWFDKSSIYFIRGSHCVSDRFEPCLSSTRLSVAKPAPGIRPLGYSLAPPITPAPGRYKNSLCWNFEHRDGRPITIVTDRTCLRRRVA